MKNASIREDILLNRTLRPEPRNPAWLTAKDLIENQVR